MTTLIMANSGDSLCQRVKEFISAVPCYDQPGLDPKEGYSGTLESLNNMAEGYSSAESERNGGWDPNEVSTVYETCGQNNVKLLWEMLESEEAEEATGEVDINGRNGPMVGCCWGFLGIVDLLCNYSGLDINQQDQVGNTALMTAAQAGADVKASQGRTAQDWALSAGRVETSPQIKWLLEQPCVEQVAVGYVPGSPAHKEPSVRAKAPKFQSEKITNQLKSMLRIKDPFNPQEGGVLEHMVRVTANPFSPFIATTCVNICPASPPNVRKHRGATPKIMRRFSLTQEPASLLQSKHAKGSVGVITPSVNSEERNGAKPKQGSRPIKSRAAGADPIDFLSLQLPIRNCAVSTSCIPKIELISASPLTRKREKKQLPRNKNLLPLPKWKYKQMREEKKAAKNQKEQLMEKNKRACKFSTSV